MTGTENLGPADELADTRDQLKALRLREEALRQMMISDPAARTGKHHLVEVREVQTSGTDWAELTKMYPQVVAEFTFPRTVTRVEIAAITEDGEIVRRRRKQEAK